MHDMKTLHTDCKNRDHRFLFTQPQLEEIMFYGVVADERILKGEDIILKMGKFVDCGRMLGGGVLNGQSGHEFTMEC